MSDYEVTWTEDEDEGRRVFPSKDDAETFAKELQARSAKATDVKVKAAK